MSDSYFAHCFQQLIAAGEARTCSLEYAALAYLDGKQTRNGKTVTRSERHAAFWSSNFLIDLPAQSWQSRNVLTA